MTGIVYPCFVCGQFLEPSDDVVQTVEVRQVRAISGAVVERKLAGEWFHSRCWRGGVPPFEEIARGRLVEVLEPS